MQHEIRGTMKMTKINFPKETIKKRMLDMVIKEQTARLIAYAEREIKRIGDDISVAPERNNLDRTGNMIDSLCWGVCYGGKMKKFGYYRDERAVMDSHLHEYSNPMGESVNGHWMASQFIATYNPKNENGWEVFFAVLAPYWGYWEKGFTNKRSGNTYQWQVMTNHYDIVSSDLKPAKVTFNVYTPS